MRVRAKQYMYYNRKEYHAGDEYDMDDREAMDVKLLATLGKIEVVEEKKAPAPSPAPQYLVKDEVAEEEEKPSTAVSPMTTENQPVVSEKRRYIRRDMRSQR